MYWQYFENTLKEFCILGLSGLLNILCVDYHTRKTFIPFLILQCFGLYSAALNTGLTNIEFPYKSTSRKTDFFCLNFMGWNSWTAFLVEVSRHELESSQTRVFIWFSTLIFRSTKCGSWKDSSFLVSGIFCKDY